MPGSSATASSCWAQSERDVQSGVPGRQRRGRPDVTGSNSDAAIIADNRPWTFNVFW